MDIRNKFWKNLSSNLRDNLKGNFKEHNKKNINDNIKSKIRDNLKNLKDNSKDNFNLRIPSRTTFETTLRTIESVILCCLAFLCIFGKLSISVTTGFKIPTPTFSRAQSGIQLCLSLASLLQVGPQSGFIS